MEARVLDLGAGFRLERAAQTVLQRRREALETGRLPHPVVVRRPFPVGPVVELDEEPSDVRAHTDLGSDRRTLRIAGQATISAGYSSSRMVTSASFCAPRLIPDGDCSSTTKDSGPSYVASSIRGTVRSWRRTPAGKVI